MTTRIVFMADEAVLLALDLVHDHLLALSEHGDRPTTSEVVRYAIRCAADRIQREHAAAREDDQ